MMLWTCAAVGGSAACVVLAEFLTFGMIRITSRTRIVALFVALAAASVGLFAAEAKTHFSDYGSFGTVIAVGAGLLLVLVALFWKTTGPKAS